MNEMEASMRQDWHTSALEFCECTCWLIRRESVISFNMTSHTCNGASPKRTLSISMFRR